MKKKKKKNGIQDSSVEMTDPSLYATSSKCPQTVTFFGGVKRNKRNHKKIF